MKTAFAVRHVHFEDLGLLGPLLRERGYAIRYREAGTDSLDDDEMRGADLVVLLGGPIGAYEAQSYPFLEEETALAAHRLAAGAPILGICLGAQVMAGALGCRVYPSGVKELGWAPVSLTEAGMASPLGAIEGLDVLHWHGDTFDLPVGADWLASTGPVLHQAYAIGKTALGLQFHLEADAAGLERWYIGHALEIAGVAGVDVPSLRRQASAAAPRLAPAAKKAFSSWLDGLG